MGFTILTPFCHANHMRKNVAIILTGVLILAILYAAYDMFVPVQQGNKNIEVRIPKGASFRQAVDILFDEKLIHDKKIFMLVGRLSGADRKIRAGYYSMWTAMSPLEVLKILRKGRIIEYEIKVLEGDSLFEIAETIAKTGIAAQDEFMRLARDPDFMEAHEIYAPSIEGYIFPDTYLVPKGIDLEDAVGNMIDRMRQKYSEELVEKTKGMGMSETQVLTLASIIEKEAVVDEERGLISAVYHNRLKRNMPLQADPTAIYGVKSSKEKIVKADLVRKTAYNTYVINGLPPGPIASPGLKSIVAALNPEKVPYIYFVSNNDGTHKFSVTLGEHEQAVRAYRDRKKAKEAG